MITVVGGTYVERCTEPAWDEVYGSGGRAAAAISGMGIDVRLRTYIGRTIRDDILGLAAAYGFAIDGTEIDTPVEFSYFHSLSTPTIRPRQISQQAPLEVEAPLVLRFGMLEGDAIVKATTAVYDPQSAFEPRHFSANGSHADHLAVILNRNEAQRLTGEVSPTAAAAIIALTEKAEVVVVKLGGHGALVVSRSEQTLVPAYQSDFVWKIGSGDVFSAVFAAAWGNQHMAPRDAADMASRATAYYCGTRSLPVPHLQQLSSLYAPPVTPRRGTVYLAAPFFDLGQRWIIEEARHHLTGLGADVFSPFHEVGPGPAETVAPADLKGIDECDAVMAVLSGLDPGTVFEVGYAIARGKPVVVLAQNLKDEDLKMMSGSGCIIVDDFVTALYQVLWAIRN